MMPSQKCGTDSPERARRLATTSTGVPWRVADTRPAGMPSTSATSTEARPGPTGTGSLRVIGARASGELEPFDADDAVRMRREALHAPAEAGEDAPVPEVECRHLPQQNFRRLVVELLALRHVDRVARLRHQRVEGGVAVAAVVLRALARVVREDVAVGVGTAAPEREVGLEVAALAGLQHRDVLLALQRHRDPGLGQHGLDQLRGLLAIALGRQDQREGGARLAGLAQQRLRARDVALSHRQPGVVEDARGTHPLVAGAVL